jgi:hypothetical protein
MKGKKNDCMEETKFKKHFDRSGDGKAIYGLGFIGALVYYVSTAPNFWAAVIGIVKAILWPAFLVYGLLQWMGM